MDAQLANARDGCGGANGRRRRRCAGAIVAAAQARTCGTGRQARSTRAVRRALSRSWALVLLLGAIAPLPARAQAEKFPEGTIGKIEFEGNATITPDKIKPKLLSRVGQTLDQNKLEADLKTLMASKWFSKVDYFLEESPPKSGKYTLLFVVREMPVLTKVEFRGRKNVRLKDIEDTTELKVGKRADPTRTWLAVGQIQRLYQEKGYDLVSVTLLEGGNPGDTKIVIEIFEGPKVKVGGINFVGNHFASAPTLKTHIATRKPIVGLFGRYNADMLDEDRQKLIEYYQAQGFFEVKVTPVTRNGPMLPARSMLTFVIFEGTRYTVRNVVIEGNSKIKTETLRKDLELHSGKPFIMAVREADKTRMLIQYGEIGCIDAEIGCEPRFTDQPGIVDLVYKIEEREPYLLGELRIVGNARTKDKVIRREAVMAGLLPGRGPGQEPDGDIPAAADVAGLFPAGSKDQTSRSRSRSSARRPQGPAVRRTDAAALERDVPRRGCRTRAQARTWCRRRRAAADAGARGRLPDPTVPGLLPFGPEQPFDPPLNAPPLDVPRRRAFRRPRRCRRSGAGQSAASARRGRRAARARSPASPA